jgi:predicted CXXCH cytochrome family protein
VNTRQKSLIVIIVGMMFVCALSAWGASVVGSKHDISSSGEQVCIYCHTPHFANTTNNLAPLWNRIQGAVTFTMYNSPTIDMTKSSVPLGVSLACLGCHDGVNSNNNKHDLVVGPGGSMPDLTSNPNCMRCHGDMWGGSSAWKLGTDLKNDHPISIIYDNTKDSAFVASQNGTVTGLPLYGGRVECSTCHNVHDPSKAPFLRIANTGSALCFKCHIK